ARPPRSERYRSRTPRMPSRPITSSPPRKRRRTWPATTGCVTARASTARPTSPPCTDRRGGRDSGPKCGGASSSGPTCSPRATTTLTTVRRSRCERCSPRTFGTSSTVAWTWSSRRPRRPPPSRRARSSPTWETVIGLETHVQLRTVSKMFCGCSTAFGAPPNTQVCPVCLGLPGALPVPNEAAVRLAVRAALALGCEVHERSVFARKNYFYPDLPKGYQISQFEQPLATAGSLSFLSPDRGVVTVTIGRLHVEEDAGKSLHDRFPKATAVDLNRSGVPLVEIVTGADVRSPVEARAYLLTLKQVLEYAGVSDCDMEKG